MQHTRFHPKNRQTLFHTALDAAYTVEEPKSSGLLRISLRYSFLLYNTLLWDDLKWDNLQSIPDTL